MIIEIVELKAPRGEVCIPPGTQVMGDVPGKDCRNPRQITHRGGNQRVVNVGCAVVEDVTVVEVNGNISSEGYKILNKDMAYQIGFGAAYVPVIGFRAEHV